MSNFRGMGFGAFNRSLRVTLANFSFGLVVFACKPLEVVVVDAPSQINDEANQNLITYSSHVGKIFSENCVSCHADGEIAPFALDNYQDASDRAAWILNSVSRRSMPPSNVDNSGKCNQFTNARWLPDSDIEVIRQWVNSGAKRGSVTYRAPDSVIPTSLSRNDHQLEMEGFYTPSEETSDEYRCFFLNQPIISGANKMVGFEVLPGDIPSVHHAILMTFDSDAAVSLARVQDAADSAMGFSCFGGVPGTQSVGVWAAGGAPFEYAGNKGFEIPYGRPLLMQVHYFTGNGVKPDLTKINLKLSSDATPVSMFFVTSLGIDIPKGIASHKVEGNLIAGIPVTTAGKLLIPPGLEVELLAAFPHMHKLGKSAKLKFTKDGVGGAASEEVCLADSPRWNFNWQDTYLYKEPIVLGPGTWTPHIECVFDSTKNWPLGRIANITFGEGSQDEMCFYFVHYLIRASTP